MLNPNRKEGYTDKDDHVNFSVLAREHRDVSWYSVSKDMELDNYEWTFHPFHAFLKRC